MATKVLIIGAGPAGLFAADELLKNRNFEVIIIDKGKNVKDRLCKMNSNNSCAHCNPCNIMCGVGGSGTFSDGTLNLRYDIGGDLTEYTDKKTAEELVKYVDNTFVKYGASKEIQNYNTQDIIELKRKANAFGAKFIEIKQRHMGSDAAPEIINNFKNDLEKRGAKFVLNTEVTDLIIENNVCKGVVADGRRIKADKVILCPGRVGYAFVNNLIDTYKIEYQYASIDVGVRVEVPAIVMEPVTKINRDPKFHIYTKTYDDFVRTFCTNEYGYVVKEEYDGFVTTNGHSLKHKKSQNTNFAFLVKIDLTEPLENTTKYAKSIAKLATTIGGGKPLVQRIGDLRRGRRSTWDKIKRNTVENTLNEVTPGDITMALPHRIVTDIEEGLGVLNNIVPGITADSTLLYTPEIKFYSIKFRVDKDMQTSIKNLYGAGDGCGLSRDIVNSAATGILAGQGI
ncbi:MAG: FAD-dependent oxidoreductase [Candidatus Aenigmarchaeota archaeon ex4484_56]|nr:MAG: FAD-dependent oxidoreductase [Candidatus Aenigmarchaeota archaeon ex4484_56]